MMTLFGLSIVQKTQPIDHFGHTGFRYLLDYGLDPRIGMSQTLSLHAASVAHLVLSLDQ